MTNNQKHAARLREIKYKIGYIAVHGHHRGYDWNADPMRLTLTEGEANELLDQAIAGAEALEAQEVKVTRVMDPDAAAYHARLALHLDRMEAIYERIAKALEPKEQGRWTLGWYNEMLYFIPNGREGDWENWLKDVEPGEYTAIVPSWAVPVPDDVVITGWERP